MVGFVAQLCRLVNLLLQFLAVVLQLSQLVHVLVALLLVLNLLVPQNDHVHLRVLLNFLLRSELLLGHLLRTFLVQVGRLNFHLQLFQLVRLNANSLNFASSALVGLLLLGESAREGLLHADHINAA